MSEALEFEVRPIEGVSVAIGETVTFREEGGKLLALNEDGEAFGTVPGKFAAQLREMGLEGLKARVTARSDGVPTVAAGAAEAAAEAANAADTSTADADAAQRPGVPQDATQQQPGAPANNAGQSYEQFLADGTSGENTEGAQAQDKPKKKKGKRIAIVVLLVVALLFVGCVALLAVPTDDSTSSDTGSSDSTSSESGSAAEEEETAEETQTVSDDAVSFEVPSSWAVEESDDWTKTGAGDGSTLISFYSGVELDGSFSAEELSSEFIESLTDESTVIDEDSLEESVTDDGVIIQSYDTRLTDEYGIEKTGTTEFIFSGSTMTMVVAWSTAGADEANVSALESALENMVIEDPSEPDVLEVKNLDETLFDEGGITITATSVGESRYDVYIDVTISNDSGRAITISANDDFAIGETMTNVWFSTTVASGKVAYEQIEFSDLSSIDELTEFSGTLDIRDDDTYDDLYEPEISMSFE